MTDNSKWHEVVSSRVYSPAAFNCRRRSQTPINAFRTSSSVMLSLSRFDVGSARASIGPELGLEAQDFRGLFQDCYWLLPETGL